MLPHWSVPIKPFSFVRSSLKPSPAAKPLSLKTNKYLSYLKQDWQTTTCGPILAHLLFLYGLQAKNGFYSLDGWGKLKRRMFISHEDYVEFTFQSP